ncbi:hypothetical protein MJO28_010743 [Puccinia striiformis f. sp. tritici]|uniref:Uncharacterized protein n=3 Tax=Puccinia striiformis TaxID=27350 RepID=A0A2S4UFR4_9BASI|nr:hypothetical protein MJO28_010743 [Puccinia striiformis f. sp. tritici]KAI7948824.1 hypothetical protein MJO29_010489 [Puccinia striiformis f. sp. tritici]POV96120.1 hypothetical protein PSHT_15312 [Puccinia striiformis]
MPFSPSNYSTRRVNSRSDPTTRMGLLDGVLYPLRKAIFMIAATCDLALAFDCYSGHPDGGCLVAPKTVVAADHPDPDSTYYSCSKGAHYCCLKDTFKAKVPDIGRCKPV